MSRNRSRLSMAVSVLAVSCAACGSDVQPDPGPPATWSVSFQWDSSDPSVDLESTAVQVIRAAVESDDIEVGIGRPYTYPGYPEAAGPNGTVGGGPRLDEPVDQIGTLHLKLVVQERSNDAVDAVVCRDETDLSRSTDGHYPLPPTTRSLALWTIGISAERSTATPTGTQTPFRAIEQRAPAMAPMSGPLGRVARPTGNVFGDWKITRYEDDYSEPTRELCYSWAEQRWGGQNPPQPTRTENEPPAVEPFHPGWPS